MAVNNWFGDHRTFISFSIFGLVNNILYVVILSSAVDLVGLRTPKAVVLLADIIPAFVMKLTAPFFIHLIPYKNRIWMLVGLSTVGMVLVSISKTVLVCILGILLASLLSGLGELTFLQLTHFYDETQAISGFSTGTGAAGLAGSFIFMLMTSILHISALTSLLLFAVVPSVFVYAYFYILPVRAYTSLQGNNINDHNNNINNINNNNINDDSDDYESLGLMDDIQPFTSRLSMISIPVIKSHVQNTLKKISPLVVPYMIPLCSVYVSEYTINQGISPTLLFPLDSLPKWLFSSYRDIYVVYGFLYQLGVFISRASVRWIRFKKLYLFSVLQFCNVILLTIQSMYNLPFRTIWLLLVLIFYEGLLGGFLYANTFMSVSEEVPYQKREFSMGCVGISDSFGIVLAGCINWWLEKKLCSWQVSHGRDWCMK